MQQFRRTLHWDKQADAFMCLLHSAVAEQATPPPAEVKRWEGICDEYNDVFGDPGLPPERAVKHAIPLHDESLPPPKPRQYRMSQS